ncbi:MAG TPA: hypothetical protein VIR16_11240 [Candidatus Limnocylindrales bacterium]
MDVVAAIVIGLTVLLALCAEPLLERLNRRSAWGEFLRLDREGRTLFVPFGTAAYVVKDPAVVGRIERLSARAFSLLIEDAVLFAGVMCALIFIEEELFFGIGAALFVTSWVALMAWVIHEARTITAGLPRR